MTGDDYGQVTTVVARLGDALSMVNPVELGSVVRSVIREIGTPPPGDPARLRALAAAYRAAADAAEPLEREVRVLGSSAALPDRWPGVVATSGRQVVRAAAAAVGGTPVALRTAAAGLDELAGRVAEQRRRHAELHEQLRAAVYDAGHVGGLPLPDPTAVDDLVRAAAMLIRGCIGVYTDAIAAADRATAVFADVAGAARAGVGAAGGLAAADAVVLAAQDVAIPGIGGNFDDGVLAPAQIQRAGARLAALPPADRAEVRALLDGAASSTERAYLLKALAAGHPVDGLAAFARAIAGRDDAWLHHHLTLIDRGGPGRQSRFGAGVDQYDDFTCGTTSVIVARAEVDPVYALSLTRDLEPPYGEADRAEFDRRLSAEQARVHDATTTVWPQRLGTLPAAIAGWMNRHAVATGVNYRWRLVDDTDRRDVSAALREVAAAVDGGHPVPILVGGPVPRHYVLVVGHAGDLLLIFEPSSGRTVRVPVADLAGGTLGAAVGFDHVQAVVAPR